MEYAVIMTNLKKLIFPHTMAKQWAPDCILQKKNAPTLLFFHGNGEIVEDYDDIAQIYLKLGINFLPVDYRGYGRSTGSPTVTAMMRD